MTYTVGVMPADLQAGDVIGVVPYRYATDPTGWAKIDPSWVGLAVAAPPIVAPEYWTAQVPLWAGIRMSVSWSTLVPVRRDGDDPNPPPVDDTGIQQYLYLDATIDQVAAQDQLYPAALQGGRIMPYQSRSIESNRAATYALLPTSDTNPTSVKAGTWYSIARPNPDYPWPPADPPTPPDGYAPDAAPTDDQGADGASD